MSKRNTMALGLLAIVALVLIACAPAAAPDSTPAATPTAKPQPTAQPTEKPTEAPPALGSEEMPFVIAFVPSGDADAILASGMAIAESLSERTGLIVQATVPTSYVAAIEALCAGEAHAAALNTFSYLVASERGCADVALVSVRFGSPTYAGQIITRADSGITSVEDLKGKSFCRPDEFSTSGWIIPSITMRAAGIDPDKDLNEVLDAGGHSGVVRSVYNGDCDAGATYVDARGTIQEEAPDVKEVVVVIQESAPIPNDTVSFSPDVPAEIREVIVQAFLDMDADEGGDSDLLASQDFYGWDELMRVDDSFFDAFRQELQAAGVDVADFVRK